MLLFTKDELAKVHKERLDELIAHASSPGFLAKMLAIPTTTVQGWVTRGKISKLGALKVEQHKELKKLFKSKYLRPDM